ncbi:hypothetical protein STEG23_005587, partial [Scotinomys teguina]
MSKLVQDKPLLVLLWFMEEKKPMESSRKVLERTTRWLVHISYEYNIYCRNTDPFKTTLRTNHKGSIYHSMSVPTGTALENKVSSHKS